MEPDLTTTSSVSLESGLRGRLVFWILLGGNRIVIAGGIVAAVVLVTAALIRTGVVAVGPNSSTATVFGSGLVAGVATLTTIALSINQLVLSRMFGSPNELTDRLSGTRDFRRTVEELAGEPSSPNDPAAFLSLLAQTLRDRALALETAIETSGWDPPAEVSTAVRDLADYGENIADDLSPQTDIVDVLHIVLGPEYARNMTAVDHLQGKYADSLPEDGQTELDAVEELVESIAVSRQFFKTISLQEDLGQLSRFIVYLGLIAFLTGVWTTLLYQTSAVTVPMAYLPAVVSVAIAVVVAPFAVFISYMVRAATIARRTVSVGPFIPPGEE